MKTPSTLPTKGPAGQATAIPTRSHRAIARNLAALALGLLPAYSVVLFTRLTQGRSFTLHEMIAYPLVVGSVSLVAILAILRFFCRQSLSTLNARPGSWLWDLAVGLGLAIVFVVLSMLGRPLLARLPAPPRNPEAMTLIVGLIEHPLLLLVWFGPVLWIGVAAFEEVSRVFTITRILDIWPGAGGQGIAVAGVTILAAATHGYQGAPGMVSTGVMALITVLVYLRLGRLWPLIVSHALYDAWSIGMGVVVVSRMMPR